MSEAQWDFTKMQWDAYISQGPVTAEQKLHQLQAACEKDLLQRMYDAGSFRDLNTEEFFITQLKKLAVLVVHRSIHALNMWKMQQQPEEQIRAFAARITGTADLCNMTIPCPGATCSEVVSYRDPVVLQSLLHGMRDDDIRIRVLTRTTAGELTELTKVVDYIAAEEASINEGQSLANKVHAGMAVIKKSAHRNKLNTQLRQTSQTPGATKCRNCGGQQHGQGTPTDRETHCKAFGKTCKSCQKLHHFAHVCRSRGNVAFTESEETEETGKASGISGQFLAISGSSSPPPLPPLTSRMQHPLPTPQQPPWLLPKQWRNSFAALTEEEAGAPPHTDPNQLKAEGTLGEPVSPTLGQCVRSRRPRTTAPRLPVPKEPFTTHTQLLASLSGPVPTSASSLLPWWGKQDV